MGHHTVVYAIRHSSSVHAFIPPNDRFTQMKSILDACQAAGVSVPPEVSSFFEGSPREFGQVICGAFRERDHHGNLRSGAWQPASEYADAIAEQEEA